MSLQLQHLDARTRVLMHGEVQHDLARQALYLSPRLNDSGRIGYIPVLLDAIAKGDPGTLAEAIARGRMLNSHEMSHRRGRPYPKAVPHDAHVTLAEGEYHRYYLRGLCVRAVQDGISHLEIFRAKVVYIPRMDSEMRIGKLVGASALLDDLRANPGVDLALGVPNGPNSGLSARIPSNSNVGTD